MSSSSNILQNLCFDSVTCNKTSIPVEAGVLTRLNLIITANTSYEKFRKFCASHTGFGYALGIYRNGNYKILGSINPTEVATAKRYFDKYKYTFHHIGLYHSYDLITAYYREDEAYANYVDDTNPVDNNYHDIGNNYYEKYNGNTTPGYLKFTNMSIDIPDIEGTYELKLLTVKSGVVLSGVNLGVDLVITPAALSSITIDTTNVKKKFVINDLFNSIGLVVKAQYKVASTGTTKEETVTDYDISEPVMNSKGNQVVSVSYTKRGVTKASTYNIEIAGVQSSDHDKATKTQFVVGSKISGFPENVYAHYSDGEDETIEVLEENCSYSFATVGTTKVTVTVVTERTNETITFTYSVDVLLEEGDLHIYSLTHDISGLKFDYGDDFNLDGTTLSITLSDGTTDTGTISGSTVTWESGITSQITDGSPLEIGDTVSFKKRVTNATLTINYKGLTGTTNVFTIDVVYLEKILVTSNPTKVEYFVGETIDYTGIVVGAVIKDTALETQTTQTLDISDLEFSRATTLEFTAAEANQSVSIMVYYGGASASFSVLVNPIELDHIEYEGCPTMSYIENEHFDINDLVVKAVYTNGTEEEIDDYRLFIGTTISNMKEITKTEKMNLSYSDDTSLWVMYDNEIVEVEEFSLSLSPKTLASIDELTGDYSLDFTVGTPVNLGSLTAMISFDNGEIDSIDKTNLSYSYEVDGVQHELTEGQIFELDDIADDIELTISYTYGSVTKSITETMSISKPEMVGIELVISDENKQIVVGTNWDYTEVLTVKPVYENGLQTDEVIDSDDYTITGLTFINNSGEVVKPYGDKIIKVIYGDFIELLTVSVIPNASVEVLSASVAEDPTPIFRVGDEFNKNLLKVLAIYVGEKEAVQIYDFETIPTNGTLLKSPGIKEIIVSFGNKTAKVNINVLSASDSGYTETKRYKLAVGNTDGTLFNSIEKDGEVIYLNIEKDGSGNIVSGKALLFDENKVMVDTNSAHLNTYGLNVTLADASEAVGYITLGTEYKENAHVVLFEDPVNPIEGDGNMVVTFPHYVEGYADKINKCKFGIIYNKRLFLSGNENFKNCDWHTSPINTAQVDNADYDLDSGLDFTYFSDLDYCNYGSDDTAVVGYTVFRDGDLIVAKESSRKEATLYRRSATTISAIDYAGNKIEGQTEEGYPMFDINGNGGEGGLNNRSIVDFVGDNLMLTRSGLKAILNKEDINNNAKYVVDVSTFINPNLKNELEGAFMFPFKEELYLATSRGVYVGYYANRNEDNEYEWYFLDGYKPRIMFEIDGDVYFGQDDGRIGRYDTDYADKDRTYVGIGGVALVINEGTDEITTMENEIVVSNKYKDLLIPDNEFHLLSHYSEFNNALDQQFEMHGCLGWFMNINTKNNTNQYVDTKYIGTFGLDPVGNYWYLELDMTRIGDKIDEFFNDRKIYLDKTKSRNYINYEYRLTEVNTGTVQKRRFKITKYNGDAISLEGEEVLRMSYRISQLDKTVISEVNADGTTFKLKDGFGVEIDLIKYDDQNANYSGVISSKKPVDAYFITRPYDMGSMVYMKNIWSWIIANDTNLASEMDVGYLSSRMDNKFKTALESVRGATRLNMEKGKIDNFHFTSDKMPRVYTKHRALPNVEFIRFLFANNENSNMVLTKLSVVYTIGTEVKGVK